MFSNLFLRHNYISLPEGSSSCGAEDIATVCMNLSYYGFALGIEAYQAVIKLSHEEITSWWKDIETQLKLITGEDRKIGDFVVYKNFPAEVLNKTEAEYWLPQILMYWSYPSTFFTEKVVPRAKMDEQPRAIVLKKADSKTANTILNSYLCSPARWKEQELQDVLFLAETCVPNLAKLTFKENLIQLATRMIADGKQINITNGTDILRLAVGLSDGDISLREKSKFISFKKPVRKFLLGQLEACSNLTEDIGRRPELWKRLLHQLHPGDYAKRFPNVCRIYNELYNDKVLAPNSLLEELLKNQDTDALQLLAHRPGEFRRRLVHTLNLFGEKAVVSFTDKSVLDKLSTFQIVSLRSFLQTINTRSQRIFPPKGNWNKAQLGEPRKAEESHLMTISQALSDALKKRLPKVKVLDNNTRMIKLANNGGDTGSYTRGTRFPIPEDVEFIRTASYWESNPSKGTTWFDNGWNFFDSNWKSLGACCWNAPKFGGRNNRYSEDVGAIFSGDPVNSGEMKGRAAGND